MASVGMCHASEIQDAECFQNIPRGNFRTGIDAQLDYYRARLPPEHAKCRRGRL
jgi:hypothetical protein